MDTCVDGVDHSHNSRMSVFPLLYRMDVLIRPHSSFTFPASTSLNQDLQLANWSHPYQIQIPFDSSTFIPGMQVHVLPWISHCLVIPRYGLCRRVLGGVV